MKSSIIQSVFLVGCFWVASCNREKSANNSQAKESPKHETSTISVDPLTEEEREILKSYREKYKLPEERLVDLAKKRARFSRIANDFRQGNERAGDLLKEWQVVYGKLSSLSLVDESNPREKSGEILPEKFARYIEKGRFSEEFFTQYDHLTFIDVPPELYYELIAVMSLATILVEDYPTFLYKFIQNGPASSSPNVADAIIYGSIMDRLMVHEGASAKEEMNYYLQWSGSPNPVYRYLSARIFPKWSSTPEALRDFSSHFKNEKDPKILFAVLNAFYFGKDVTLLEPLREIAVSARSRGQEKVAQEAEATAQRILERVNEKDH